MIYYIDYCLIKLKTHRWWSRQRVVWFSHIFFDFELHSRHGDSTNSTTLHSLLSPSTLSVGKRTHTKCTHHTAAKEKARKEEWASEHQANGFKSRKCCFHFDYKLIGYRILKSRLVHAFFDLRGLWLSLSVKNIYIWIILFFLIIPKIAKHSKEIWFSKREEKNILLISGFEDNTSRRGLKRADVGCFVSARWR